MSDEFGTCDCDRSECVVARAVRRAAAEKLLEATRVEYGATGNFGEFSLWYFPAREWVCRAFPRRSSRACPGCGYTPATVPDRFAHRTVFSLNGSLYRVVAVGSTNRYSNGWHFEDRLFCEPVEQHWFLPDSPAPVSEVAKAIHALFTDLPIFRCHELGDARIILQHCPDLLRGDLT